MVFINEYIPKDDLERYNFRELNLRPKPMGSTPASDWTIDRTSDIWLRLFCFESDHTELDGGATGRTFWDFYWKGELMEVKLKLLGFGGYPGHHGWKKQKLVNISIPRALEGDRLQIIEDLESALTAYSDGGVYSATTSYKCTLEV